MDALQCRQELATLDSLRRAKVVEALLVERMIRKSRRVLEVWEECHRDWNETLYRMTAYAMGAPRNTVPFEELSRRVSYHMCLKERNSLRRVEALLLGASGLLSGEYGDDSVMALQADYAYLVGKYNVESMRAGEWTRGGMMPAGNPVVRIVQMAALVSKEEFCVDGLLAIGSKEDAERLFRIATDKFWCNRMGIEGGGVSRIGRDKVNMLTINLVVPLQFAYAVATNNVALKDSSFALLEKIPAESNRLVSRWTGEGVDCPSAYDSQALIELSHLCDAGGCRECPLGRMLHRG